jgi:hypothetical protein
MTKYVRVMDGLKSNAGGFDYKLDELNVASNWNPNESDPEKMSGFNFSSEDKILRWLHRGNTIYDVIVPEDAEVINVDDEKGIYRSNKIIVTNPREITDEMVIELYKKSTFSNKIIAQCLLTLIWKNRLEISKYIIKDRVNIDNVDEIFNEFVSYAGEDNLAYESTQEVYTILKEIKSPIDISMYIDKEPYIRELTNDKIINITGESGSGKTYYTSHYMNDDNYIVIDTDLIFGDKETNNVYCLRLRDLFKGESNNILITDFDNCYLKIINFFKDSDKTLVIDSAQYRNIKDYSILKGKLVILRTSINKCYERTLNRWKNINNDYTEEEFNKYAERKKGMFKWYRGINRFIENIEKYYSKN